MKVAGGHIFSSRPPPVNDNPVAKVSFVISIRLYAVISAFAVVVAALTLLSLNALTPFQY